MRLNSEFERLLVEGAGEILGRPPSKDEFDGLVGYLAILTKWQRSQRLVGSVEPGWLIQNVILDSLLFARVLPTDAGLVTDLGSGAGVPGIPLKLVRPTIRLTLIESRERRASFLAAVVRELKLQDCYVVRGRAESVEATRRNEDAVVMRCAGGVQKAIPLALGLVRPGGIVIASGPPVHSGSKTMRDDSREKTDHCPRSRSYRELDWVEISWSKGIRAFAVARRSS